MICVYRLTVCMMHSAYVLQIPTWISQQTQTISTNNNAFISKLINIKIPSTATQHPWRTVLASTSTPSSLVVSPCWRKECATATRSSIDVLFRLHVDAYQLFSCSPSIITMLKRPCVAQCWTNSTDNALQVLHNRSTPNTDSALNPRLAHYWNQ